MKTKTKMFILLILTFVLMASGVVYAYSYTWETCPYSAGCTNDTKRQEGHSMYPGDNYNTWFESYGPYGYLHESWNCKKCGHLIVKNSYIVTHGDENDDNDMGVN